MPTAAAVEKKPEVATFYSWLGADEKGRKLPSSQVVYISGGVAKLANDGSKIRTPLKEARFHNGKLQTADEETIVALRKIAAEPGSGITENLEEYYNATLTSDQQARRQSLLGQVKDTQLVEANQEIDRLKTLLKEKGGEDETLPNRKQRAS